MPPIDFSGLVLGFSSAALHYLGQMDFENKSHGEKNLPMAKQNIDILEVLEQKTKGNLSSEEGQLLTAVLRDLRLKYVDASR
jgi:hypothetical protein